MPNTPAIDPLELRRASVFQLLHWLALGRTNVDALTATYAKAIEQLNPHINAFIDTRYSVLQEQVRNASMRRKQGVLGRLDGIPVAIKDNFDIAGWPTTAGLPARGKHLATRDAHAISRLRAAGAILLGKTNMDEASLGASCNNPHFGAVHNPFMPGYSAGGSSGGSVAAVASGMAAAAIGSDTLGSIRIPASYCGVVAMRPTFGEISTRGMLPSARRLDTVGLVARHVDDLTILLQVLTGYDAGDPYSRHRRVAFQLPDWDPGNLRTGIIPNLDKLEVDAEVVRVFDQALAALPYELGRHVEVDFSDWDFKRTRRSGFLLMEAEILETYAEDIANQSTPISNHLRELLRYAQHKSAQDYTRADKVIDLAALKMRRLFAQVDVLITPTTPQGAFPLTQKAPDSQGDLTAFASLAQCPAVTIPMGTLANKMPVGMQFIGPRGSDLRLLELASVCASALDVTPSYPVEPA